MTTTTEPMAEMTVRQKKERERKLKVDLGKVGINLALIAAALYFLVPIVWVLIAATKSPGQLFSTNGFLLAENPQLGGNLGRLFSQDKGVFSMWIVNSLIYSGIGAAGATILSVACGYAIAKYDFFGKEKFFSLILGGVMVPATVIALPLYFLLNTVNLTGSYWSILLPSMVSPFGVYLARIHSAAIPDSILEAARIDGAKELRIFGTMAVRMMIPAVVTIFLFQFVNIWNNYLLPLVMLNDPKTFPITLGLTLWNSQTQRDPFFYTLVVTGSAISSMFLVAVMIGLQRFWRAGMTAGAVKE